MYVVLILVLNLSQVSSRKPTTPIILRGFAAACHCLMLESCALVLRDIK